MMAEVKSLEEGYGVSDHLRPRYGYRIVKTCFS